jgi:integrase
MQKRRSLLFAIEKTPGVNKATTRRFPSWMQLALMPGQFYRSKKVSPRTERIFPYNSRSVGTAFRPACRELKIEDLHFHDLRHEGASRFFEAGFTIQQVALVTGHKDWKMLRRYTNLRPEDLRTTRKSSALS